MTTIIFFFSLGAICAMISGKLFQTRVKRIHMISKLSARADEMVHIGIHFITAKYALYRKIAYLFVFEFLPSYAYELLVRLKDYIARKYYVMGSQFRGRRILRSNGSVSFFLERLAEEKPDMSGREA